MFEMPAIVLVANSWSSWIANFSTISTTTTIPSPSQILLIFLSEPPQNPRPYKHGQLFKKFSYLQGLDKKIFLKRWGFRGGSNEKIRRMWLGLGIVVVGIPPLVQVKHICYAFFLCRSLFLYFADFQNRRLQSHLLLALKRT